MAVVGSGEQALPDSLFLADFASEISVLGTRTALAPSEYARQEAKSSPRVEIRPHAEVTAITGDDVVTGIKLYDRRAGRKAVEEVNGVLIRLGSRPNVEFLPPEIETANTGRITINRALETSMEGVFAAGTVREHGVSRVGAAIGDGTRAFHSVQRYLG